MQQPGLGGLDAVLASRSRPEELPIRARGRMAPPSAPMPTYIATKAEPVLSLLYLFLLFFYLWGPLAASPWLDAGRDALHGAGGRRRALNAGPTIVVACSAPSSKVFDLQQPP